MTTALTEWESKVAEMRDGGIRPSEIARLTGRSMGAVGSALYQVKRKRGEPIDEQQAESARARTESVIAHARIENELADGTRCGAPMGRGVCCLLRPCRDHGR